MIDSPSFAGLPAILKRRVERALARALDDERPELEFAYLPAEEKRAIRRILGEIRGPVR
jgi:hypothetical protein